MSSLHDQPWEVLSKKVVLDAAPWINVTREHVRLPNGAEMSDFFKVNLVPFAVIFAVTDEQNVVMVEHYRHGPGRVVLELPAGDIGGALTEANALESAQRELLEETGYEAEQWRFLGRFYMDSNRGCGEAWGYLATGARCTSEQATEDTEIIQVSPLPLEAVREKWLNATIDYVGASAIVGLALAHLGALK